MRRFDRESAPVETVLITGASGFLGTYLAAACRTRKWDLIGIDPQPPVACDSWRRFARTSVAEVDFSALLEGTRISRCFHLAGSAAVSASVADPWADFGSHVPGVARLLDYLKSSQPDCHIVFYSSAAVYGQPESLPVSESQPARPISPYGAHKHLVEVLLSHYSRIYGLTASVLRIFSAYGKYQRRLLFWDLLCKWEAARRGGLETIYALGSGEETRDFIHARDVAQAAVLVSSHPVAGETQIVNVASGREVTIREAALTLFTVAPFRAGVEFSGEVRQGDPLNWVADISRLSALGFRPAVSLADGLREYAEWFSAAAAARL